MSLETLGSGALRTRLLAWEWANSDDATVFLNAYMGDLAMDDWGRPDRLNVAQRVMNRLRIVGTGLEAIRACSAGMPYAVTREIGQLLSDTWTDMPDWHLEPSALPSTSGFVVFEEPIVTATTPEGDWFRVTAISWSTPDHEEIVGNLRLRSGGVDLVCWSQSSGDPRSSELHVATGRLGWPTVMGHWGIGQSTSRIQEHARARRELGRQHGKQIEDDFTSEGSINTYRVVAALWHFLEEPLIVTRTRQHAPRQLARQMERKKLHDPVVDVVELRTPVHVGERRDEPTGRHIHVRFIVRAHWRNQYYPSLGTHRLKLIPSHVRGPEGAPLKKAPKVFVVKR